MNKKLTLELMGEILKTIEEKTEGLNAYDRATVASIITDWLSGKPLC
jgi:hypothetical protein